MKTFYQILANTLLANVTNMTVWFATNTRSRKVQELRRDPRVTLYYSDHETAIGYVSLAGRAVLVEDMQEILKRKRAYWEQAFPGLKNLVLVKVVSLYDKVSQFFPVYFTEGGVNEVGL